MTEMIKPLEPARRERIIAGMIDLAHTRLTNTDGPSLFAELPYEPDIYPGQAPEEFYVPGKHSSREEMLEEGSLFCPNLTGLLAEREADVRYWETITLLVNEGYRIVPLTNHRNLPDVVLDKLVDAIILSQNKYLGKRYFDIASVAVAKPISLYQYGETKPDDNGSKRKRSAVETITMIGGVDLPIPGTRTIRESAQITDEDRRIVNAPILQRRAQMHMLGGYITNMAGSASEDWRITLPGGKVIVIQQPMSHGTIRDLTGERTIVAPRAVVFDDKWNAKIWAGRLEPVKNEPQAHDLLRLIAGHAEELSGETTRYINDHGALERIAKFRRQAHRLGERAVALTRQIIDRSDIEELDDLPPEE